MRYRGYIGGNFCYAVNDGTLLNLSRLLSRDVRLKLFEELYEAVGKRPLEKIWLATGIRKTDLYRYLPKTKSKRGGLAPSPANTVKLIRALIDNGRAEFVVNILDVAAEELRKSFQIYFLWTRSLRRRNVIYNPLSRSEMKKIENTLNFGFYDIRR
jgi:hypothetical protein